MDTKFYLEDVNKNGTEYAIVIYELKYNSCFQLE